MPSWTINEQIMSVLGLPVSHHENGRHLEFEHRNFKFGIADPKKPIPRAIA